MVAILATKSNSYEKNTANAIFALGCCVIKAAFHYVFSTSCAHSHLKALWINIVQLQELRLTIIQ
jgi:hypothetical protein